MFTLSYSTGWEYGRNRMVKQDYTPKKTYTAEELENYYKSPDGEKVQLHPSLLSITSMTPIPRALSSSRAQMFNAHIGACAVVKGANVRTLQTGVEMDVGKYTFNIKMPFDGIVLAVLERYSKQTLAKDRIEESPEIVVVVENAETGEVDAIVLPKYCSHHTYFGFKYRHGPGMSMLVPKMGIPKGTVFLESPNVTEEGDYMFGAEVNVALATLPAGAEDSVLFRRGALKKFTYNVYYSVVVEYGRDDYPLNCYGDDEVYKPHPDIGEYIRPDGLLMATRSFEPSILAPALMSVKACQKVDPIFDNTIYVQGHGGKVIDIIVHHDQDTVSRAPFVEQQGMKYHNSRLQFCEKLIALDEELTRRIGTNLKRLPKYHSLVVEAISVANPRRTEREGAGRTGARVRKIHRQDRIARFFTEFIIEYELTPGIGSKVTGAHGDKGVNCQIAEDHEMPMDSDGNIADVVFDPAGTANRMNPSRTYEQYFTGASRDARKHICKELGVPVDEKKHVAASKLMRMPIEKVRWALDYCMGLHRIINPTIGKWYDEGVIGRDPVDYVATIISSGLTIHMPTDNQKEITDTVLEIEKTCYRPVYGPITYIGNSGKRVTTKRPIRIGGIYLMLLDKDGRDGNACGISRRNHSGVPAQMRKDMKRSSPTREQAVRCWDEAGIRVVSSYCGGDVAAEVIDRNNSYQSTLALALNIIKADKPSYIQRVVDRSVVPIGGAAPLQLVKHICECAGFEFAYIPHNYQTK
jgi:hypothetical protein